MKRIITCFIGFTVMMVACTKKAMPVTGQGDKSKQTTGEQPAQKTEEESKLTGEEKAGSTDQKPAMIPGQAPPPQSDRPPHGDKPSDEETGKVVYASKCGKCHATKNVGSYTFNQWEVILKKMIPNAKLSADEESQVVSYIKANAR